MTGFKPWAALVLVMIAASCGDPVVTPVPPVEEWCDLNREREPCEIRGGSIENQADMAELCESSCTDIIVVNFQAGVELEVLKAFTGFRRVSKINVSSLAPSVKDLSFLSDVEEVQNLRVQSNPGLVSLDGIENMQFGPPCEGCERTISINYNPKLTNLYGLRNVTEVERIEINGNASLQVLDGFDQLQAQGVSIQENENLVRIRGFSGLTEIRGLGISLHPRLDRIEGFQSLKAMRSLRMNGNPRVNMCDVDRILAQLDVPPEEVQTSDGNGTPCME